MNVPVTPLWGIYCLTPLLCGFAPASPPPSVKEVRQLLNVAHFKEERQVLITMGEKAFPAFKAILSDPEATTAEVGRILGTLCEVKADRGRFLNHAVRALAHKDSGARRAAVKLLEQIGTSAEASPVVALLSDGHMVADKPIVYYAANTLAAIGGWREVVAMDAWLLGASHRDDAHLRRHVSECRDRLKKRLDERPRDPSKDKP
jgi:hypothetical protein